MEAIRTVPFIIATKEGLPLFAAVDPVGRCRRAVEKIEMEGKKEIKLVKYEELSSAFGNASRKETVIFADYILDDMTLEFAAEKLFWDVTENGIAFLTFRSKTAPIFIAGKDALHKLAALDLKTSEDPVSAVEEFCEKDPEISVNRHELERAYWSKLTDRRSAKKAQWGLLKYLQFRPGGLVAKYLNRPVSIRMSRILVNFSFVTPNFVTVADFFLGLIAVALFFFPGWEWAVAAGITIHLNSIIDGVDGEIARMRHQGSALGAWLDSICDETLGALIYLGIGYHLYVTPPAYLAGKPDLNIWFLAVGAFTGFIHIRAHPLALQKKARARVLLLVGMLQTEKGSAAFDFCIQLYEKTFLERLDPAHRHARRYIQLSGYFPRFLVHSGDSELPAAFHPHLHKKSPLVGGLNTVF